MPTIRWFSLVLVGVLCSGGSAAASPWSGGAGLAPGEVLVSSAEGFRREPEEAARREGLLVVDLSDDWVPFIFSESDGPGKPVKPNPYRPTFIALANDQAAPDELFLESEAGRAAVLSTVPAALRSPTPDQPSPDEQQALERARRGLQARRTPNYLEVYGIPPTLSVLARRVADDAQKNCASASSFQGLHRLDFEIRFQSREQAQREYAEAGQDAAWVAERLAALGTEAGTSSPEEIASRLAAADPQIDPARLERYRRGQTRLQAVRDVQDRLVCEGLLATDRFTPGAFDLATHEALATFEKKNDIFGWGFIGGETVSALMQPPIELDFQAFRRVLAERVGDAAGIVEDGSVSKDGASPVYVDEEAKPHPIPNLIADFVDALQQALGVSTPQDLQEMLRAVSDGGPLALRIAFRGPPLPPYYAPVMDLSAEIDRGDVWYDQPFDREGKPASQPRHHYPNFTLFVNWRGQKIPLVRWRTTIGSWRSELGSDGHVYLKYKNSDVGPRIWKDVVAAPVWVPPPSTPGKDLLVKKVFDRRQGPVSVVNTEIMGPGFASAYGLVMAVHWQTLEGGGVFDNQIRTHGSVDYTSIARRFSHGCHRLVNNRAVRLFGFVLAHRKHVRRGNHPLSGQPRRFANQGRRYEYRLTTRGYYYELRPPVPVTVLPGRVLGQAREPITRYVRKPGVDYGPLPPDSPVESQPVVGP